MGSHHTKDIKRIRKTFCFFGCVFGNSALGHLWRPQLEKNAAFPKAPALAGLHAASLSGSIWFHLAPEFRRKISLTYSFLD